MRRLETIELLDYREHLRPGDRLVWGQACGEPRTLVEHLVTSPVPAGLSAFVGIDVARTIGVGVAPGIRLVSYSGSGGHCALHAAGQLDVLPVHYSALPELVVTGSIAADVALIAVPPPDADGRFSLGANRDHLVDAVRRARVVIAEIDERVPYTFGEQALTEADIDVAVPARHGPAEALEPEPTAVQDAVAAHVAGLVDDGATVQLGVGSLVEAVCRRLAGHRRLGVHTGLIPDGVADLMAAGVVTNERKTLDRGLTVGGMLLGSRKLFDFAHRNDRILVRGTRYTHAQPVLAAMPRFTAINSAVEVDLTGQVNAEVARGRYLGAIGGAADFLRGAAASPGGVPIVMLPSTAGRASRIVAALSGPVSTARSDVGVVVTEHGCADLRGLTLAQRAQAMIAVAAPEHRASLSSVADAALATATSRPRHRGDLP